MTLRGLVLILTLSLISRDADSADPDAHCDDCNHSGRWWPLFKPSQIIHSEFPEHAQRRSQEVYGHGLFQLNSVEQPARLVSHGSRETAGIDSEVKTYSSQGKHRLEWEHYGDVSHVTTVGYNSLEARRDDAGVSEENGGNPPGAAEHHGEVPLEKDHTEEGEGKESKENSKASEENFFDDRHFFKEEFTVPKSGFPKEFEISEEYSSSQEPSKSFSKEVSKEISSKETLSHERQTTEPPPKDVSPVYEDHKSEISVITPKTHETISRLNNPVVATSYAAFSSVFARSKPVNLNAKDLLHPSYNEVSNYVQSPRSSPVSRSQFFNGFDVSKQYLVHEHQPEDEILRVNPLARAGVRGQPEFRNSPLAPKEPFVHRYVKSHGGLLHYRHQPRPHPLSRSSSLRWQDHRPQTRSKFPYKPFVHVQSHETRVRHVIPSKDSSRDSLWKETSRVESFKPPPAGQNLYGFKKKPHMIDLKKIERNKGSSVVYIIKANKRLS